MSVRESLSEWLRSLSADDASRVLLAEDDVLRSVANAHETEVLEALDVLWPLTRSVTREHCWELLSRDDLEQTRLREEIRAYLNDGPLRQHALNAGRDAWEREHEAKKLRERNLSLIVEEARELTGDGPERYLPSVNDAGGSESLAPPDITALFRRGFTFLTRLSELLAPLIGSRTEFLAVLGPVYDALCWRAPQGFAPAIDEARLALIDSRVREGQADLYDAWRWLRCRTDDVADQHDAAAVLEIADRASIAELEVFFSWWAYDDDDEGTAIVFPEVLLPDPARLWLRILKRPAISRGLLERAGEYFWENSDDQRGPAKALAALAVRWETEFDFAEVVWVVFWKAFEDASEMVQWDLAIDCLSRSLYHIGGRVRAKPDEVARQIDQYNPGMEYFEEACLRSLDDRQRYIRFLLWWAWSEMPRTSSLTESRIGRRLRRVGQLANVEAAGLTITLPARLGEGLWGNLEADTRALLLQAEELWIAKEGRILLSDDHGLIGAAFRRAVEHEWRVRLRGMPGLSGNGLGRMIGDLREFGPVGVGWLRRQFGAHSPLADQRFLRDAQAFSSGWLNPGAHEAVLDRAWCEELRRRLWDQGWLKELLGGVHASPP